MDNKETIYFLFTKNDHFPFLECPNGLKVQKINYFRRKILNSIWRIPSKSIWTRFTRGDHCYIALLDDKPVHYSWVQKKRIHFVKPENLYVKVKKDEIWIYHCRTAESARGKNIYPLVLQEIIKKELRKKKRTVYIYTTEANVASINGIKKAGFKQIKFTI